MTRHSITLPIVVAAFFFCSSEARAGEPIGPDVVASDVLAPANWGAVDDESGFSFGSKSCNVGDASLGFVENTALHPAYAQNLYRIDADGRFMQIGMSWLFHGYCALQIGNVCGTCTPNCGGCCGELGAGCSSTDSSVINGGQARMGPRSEVNIQTGEFPWPHGAFGLTGNAVYKRVRVRHSDLNLALNENASFFSEVQIVASDDAATGNAENSISTRSVQTSGLPPNISLAAAGPTLQMQSAIEQWPIARPGAIVLDVPVPGEGLFHIGAYVRDNGDGTWMYSYAVHNQTSHLSGHSFAVPVGAGVTISDVGFHDVDYHSGEPYTNAAWTAANANGMLRWTADATFAENENANALRWGTTYSFWFTADVGPEEGDATLGLFRDPAVVLSVRIPSPSSSVLLIGDVNCDGLISVSDIAPFVLALTDANGYASQFPACDIASADINGDSLITVGDIGPFVSLLTR
ncbi:MAG: hypothetical protein AB7N71_12525 [Phycisphaerae bacterium]